MKLDSFIFYYFVPVPVPFFSHSMINFQLKIEDMKIVLDSQQQQESIQEQQQFVIIQSQSLAQKQKVGNSENEEVVYVFKDESGSDQPIIQIDSNGMNQDQFVWIANEQANDGTSQVHQPSAIYTIKEMNFAQVNFCLFCLILQYRRLLIKINNNFRTSRTLHKVHQVIIVMTLVKRR